MRFDRTFCPSNTRLARTLYIGKSQQNVDLISSHFSFLLGQCPTVSSDAWTTVRLVIFKGSIFHEFALIIASSRMQFSRIFAMDSISVVLLKYFKVLNFTNLVCTTKFLKYKSLENFQLYAITSYLLVQFLADSISLMQHRHQGEQVLSQHYIFLGLALSAHIKP